MKTELVPINATFPPELIEQIDRRAKALDLTRSQYLRRLAREDMETRNAEQMALKLKSEHAHAA